MIVKDLENKDLILVDSGYEKEAIIQHIGRRAKEFDSFFVRVEDGDYAEVYGMKGTIPYLNRNVEQLVPYKRKEPRRKKYYKVRIFCEAFVIKADEYSAAEAKEKAIALACQHYCLDLNDPIKVTAEEITKEEFHRDFED